MRTIISPIVLSEEIECAENGSYLTYEIMAIENGALSVFFAMCGQNNKSVYIHRTSALDPEYKTGKEECDGNAFVYSYPNTAVIPEDKSFLKAFSDIVNEIRVRARACFTSNRYKTKYPERKRTFDKGEYYKCREKTYTGVYTVVKEGQTICFGRPVDIRTGDPDGTYEKICEFPFNFRVQDGENLPDDIPIRKTDPILSDRDIMSKISTLLYEDRIAGSIPAIKSGHDNSYHISFMYRGEKLELTLYNKAQEFRVTKNTVLGDGGYGIVTFEYRGQGHMVMYVKSKFSGHLFLFFDSDDTEAAGIPDLENKLKNAGV